MVICGRQKSLLESAAAELRKGAPQGIRVSAVEADVSQAADVERLVSETLAITGGLNIIVNNAGILGPIGTSESIDWPAWQRTIEVNLFGPMLLATAAIRLFKEQRNGRIINLSGGGAANPRPLFSAYATSKAALVRLTENLAEEVSEFGITVNAVAPGAMNTEMLEEALAAGPEKLGQVLFGELLAQKRDGGASITKAAALCVMLASEAGANLTGKLISAVWDPWQDLPGRSWQIKNTDVYTLRRIVPADRGLIWE